MDGQTKPNVYFMEITGRCRLENHRETGGTVQLLCLGMGLLTSAYLQFQNRELNTRPPVSLESA